MRQTGAAVGQRREGERAVTARRAWDDDGEDARRCSVEGCHRAATVECEACGEWVCGAHSEHLGDLGGMALCFSCAIGMKDGMDLVRHWEE